MVLVPGCYSCSHQPPPFPQPSAGILADPCATVRTLVAAEGGAPPVAAPVAEALSDHLKLLVAHDVHPAARSCPSSNPELFSPKPRLSAGWCSIEYLHPRSSQLSCTRRFRGAPSGTDPATAPMAPGHELHDLVERIREIAELKCAIAGAGGMQDPAGDRLLARPPRRSCFSASPDQALPGRRLIVPRASTCPTTPCSTPIPPWCAPIPGKPLTPETVLVFQILPRPCKRLT